MRGDEKDVEPVGQQEVFKKRPGQKGQTEAGVDCTLGAVGQVCAARPRRQDGDNCGIERRERDEADQEIAEVWYFCSY